MPLPAVLGAIGLGLSLIGQLRSASAQRQNLRLQTEYGKKQAELGFLNADLIEKTAHYNYAIAQMNAAAMRATAGEILFFGEQASELAWETAKIEADRTRRLGLKILGEQGAAYSKAGVTFEGTPSEIIGETAGEIELDAQIIEWGGRVQQWEILTQSQINANQLYRQADITEAAAAYELELSKFEADLTRQSAQLQYDYAEVAYNQGSSAIRTNTLFNVGGSIISAWQGGVFNVNQNSIAPVTNRPHNPHTA